MRKVLFIIFISFFTLSNAEEIKKVELKDIFLPYSGTLVIYNNKDKEMIIYNNEQANKRNPPESTYKIMNTLIGLETGVINENTEMEWDKQKYSIESWNRNHNLFSAISNSVVWYFQRVARLIGKEKMKEYLTKINYGNMDISDEIDKFWLDSTLEISAKEQVLVLNKIIVNNEVFDKKNIEILKRAIYLEEINGVKLYGKTGSSGGARYGKLGWFVGFIEKDNNIYTFAVNIEDENNSASGYMAKEKLKKSLKVLGLY